MSLCDMIAILLGEYTGKSFVLTSRSYTECSEGWFMCAVCKTNGRRIQNEKRVRN